MEYRGVGCSGLKVSELCLSTMTFGQGVGERSGDETRTPETIQNMVVSDGLSLCLEDIIDSANEVKS